MSIDPAEFPTAQVIPSGNAAASAVGTECSTVRRYRVRGKRRPAHKWPYYPPETVQTMERFFDVQIDLLQSCLNRAQGTWERHPDHPGTKGQMDYWRNGLSVLRWVRSKISDGQKHLLEPVRDPAIDWDKPIE